MKIKYIFPILFFTLIFASPLFSEDFISLSATSNSLEFSTNVDNNFTIDLKNLSQIYQIQIDSIKLANSHYNLFFSTENMPINLEVGKTKSVQLKVNSKQNINYKLALFIYYTIPDLKQNLVAVFNEFLKFKYNDLYDEFTQNLTSLDLKKSLSNYLSTHTSLTYKDARQNMFSHIDNIDGWVECVYTGRKLQTTGIPDVNTTHFNNEHTWPQSQGADVEPPKSDIYHMYPTDETANAKRGDFPFGYVVSNVVWEQGGSKLGKDKNNYTVFEPRDVHKGNVARSMFYFSITYNNPSKYLNQQETTLRQWMDVDPVDDRERYRNDEIAKLQGKRNPFIDHPEFLDRIYSISTDEVFPNVPSLETPSTEVDISSRFLTNGYNYDLFITNSGIYPLLIDSLELINKDHKPIIIGFNNIYKEQLPPDSTIKISLKLNNDLSDNQQENIIIIHYNSNQNTKQVSFKELYINSIAALPENSKLSIFHLNSNFYEIQIPESFSSENVNIAITDIYGRNLYNYSSDYQNKIALNLNQFTGLYFIQVYNSKTRIVAPIILVK
jgi:endonuclease I